MPNSPDNRTPWFAKGWVFVMALVAVAMLTGVATYGLCQAGLRRRDAEQAEAYRHRIEAVREQYAELMVRHRRAGTMEDIHAFTPEVRMLDTAGCPDDFRLAFLEYAQAWEMVSFRLAALPKTRTELAMHTLARILGGDRSGGTKEMVEMSQTLLLPVMTAKHALERVALRSGVVFLL